MAVVNLVIMINFDLLQPRSDDSVEGYNSWNSCINYIGCNIHSLTVSSILLVFDVAQIWDSTKVSFKEH